MYHVGIGSAGTEYLKIHKERVVSSDKTDLVLPAFATSFYYFTPTDYQLIQVLYTNLLYVMLYYFML